MSSHQKQVLLNPLHALFYKHNSYKHIRVRTGSENDRPT